MSAGFIKRAVSTVLDITIVLLIVGLTFLIGGRSILRNQIPDFNIIYTNYTEVVAAYNADLDAAKSAYDAAVAQANGNSDLENTALAVYQARTAILNQQNAIDIEPFNRPLSTYFLDIFYYFSIGFLLLMSIYAVAVKGKTLGRTIMQLRPEGSVNPFSIMMHDVVIKYFFILVFFLINIAYGALYMLASLLIGAILIGMTQRKAALRDTLTRVRIVKIPYGG